MQNFPCLAILFQCFFPVLRSATFFFIYFFRCSLYHLVVMHREIKSRDSFQVLECLKTIPSSPNSARTPSPTFLNERKCHSEIWSSSRQRISEHCLVCDLISHIGHAREKPSPLLKISWNPEHANHGGILSSYDWWFWSRYNLVPVSLFFFHGDRFFINMRVLVLIFVWKTRRKTSARS